MLPLLSLRLRFQPLPHRLRLSRHRIHLRQLPVPRLSPRSKSVKQQRAELRVAYWGSSESGGVMACILIRAIKAALVPLGSKVVFRAESASQG
jgi:hypothetical protein